MIQSIVEQKAFQRGHEYFTESRVRLLEADDTDIAATVRGNSGVYEQTIRLREGNLVTACSCSLIEQPMCRHCVAVLLEFHRWASQRGRREVREAKESRIKEPGSNGKASGALDQDVRLSEVIAFVEWAQPAMRSLAKNESVADAPRLPNGMAGEWVQTIISLDRQRRDHEEVNHALHADLAQRDLQLQQLRQQIKMGQEELGSARENTQRLEQDLANYKSVMAKLTDLSKNIGRFDAEVKEVAGDLSKSRNHLEDLARSFRDVAIALQDLAKQRLS